jgi:hypothetical protein
MFKTHHQSTDKIAACVQLVRPLKVWQELKYLGKNVPSQICIHEEIKGGLYSGNICYHAVWGLVSSHLLSENITFTKCIL